MTISFNLGRDRDGKPIVIDAEWPHPVSVGHEVVHEGVVYEIMKVRHVLDGDLVVASCIRSERQPTDMEP